MIRAMMVMTIRMIVANALWAAVIPTSQASRNVPTSWITNAETGIFSAVVNPAKRTEVFTVMNQIFRADMAAKKFVERRELDQTYYAVNISSDGKEIYLGGALDKVAIYDTATLTRQAEIVMPGGADQATASMRIIRR